MACNRWGDLVDAELHRFGLCLCALYPEIRPARLPWVRADIERLVGLMGFVLVENPDGTFYAHDPTRGLYNPHNPAYGLAYDRLGDLVISVGCAHSLAGPMTAAQAREQLERWGMTLTGSMHRTWGWVWVAHHPASDHHIDGGFNLAHLVDMARSHLRYLGTYQPVLELVADTPKPRLRPEALRALARPKLLAIGPAPRRARPLPRAEPSGQIALDLFAGGASAPPPGADPLSREGGYP
jgi:hypothetical protein